MSGITALAALAGLVVGIIIGKDSVNHNDDHDKQKGYRYGDMDHRLEVTDDSS